MRIQQQLPQAGLGDGNRKQMERHKMNKYGYLMYRVRAKANNTNWVWWYMPITPVLGKLRQEDCCKASLDLSQKNLHENNYLK